MSTRAVYTFCDKRDRNEFTETQYHVYKHHDGYPTGAAQWIANALDYAWPLPRYEAADFGAAFIAGNKRSMKDGGYGGGVYMTKGYKHHGDLEYRYEIRCPHADIFGDAKKAYIEVTAFAVNSSNESRQIFKGSLQDFTQWADQEEAISNAQ